MCRVCVSVDDANAVVGGFGFMKQAAHGHGASVPMLRGADLANGKVM